MWLEGIDVRGHRPFLLVTMWLEGIDVRGHRPFLLATMWLEEIDVRRLLSYITEEVDVLLSKFGEFEPAHGFFF